MVVAAAPWHGRSYSGVVMVVVFLTNLESASLFYYDHYYHDQASATFTTAMAWS